MEIWKDIKEYEGLYQISDKGRVKSLERIVKACSKGTMRIKKESYMKISTDSKGYKFVGLWENNKGKNHRIHRLLMSHFVKESELQVNHIDGNKLNNKLENLEYVTQRENLTHGNRKRNKHSQLAGVTWHKGRWQSTISINSKTAYLGRYDTEEEAHKAYLKALCDYNIKNKYA